MNRISTVAAFTLLSQAAFGVGTRGNFQDQTQSITNDLPLVGSELSNANLELKNKKSIRFFTSLSMIPESSLSEHPLIRFRLQELETGKEKYFIISLEPESNKKDAKLVFVDRTNPKIKAIIGEAFDSKTFLQAYGEKPELFFKDKVIAEFLAKQGILLRGHKKEDLGSLYEKPIQISLMPSTTQDNTRNTTKEFNEASITERISYTYQMPPADSSGDLNIKYAISMSRFNSELFGLFSRVVTSEQVPDVNDPSIITEFHTVVSDVNAVVTYFGTNSKTGSKAYHVLVARDGEVNPISSNQIIEEKDGTITIISHDSSKGVRFDRKIGQVKTPLNFEALSLSYNGEGKPFLPTERKLMDLIMKPFTSNPKVIDGDPTTTLFPSYNSIEGDTLLPIHTEAYMYAQKRAKDGVGLIQILSEVLKGLNIPARINPSKRKIHLQNPENPRLLKKDE